MALALCLLVWTASAQTPARLSGAIHDQTGAALAGATILLKGAESRETQAGADGAFEIRSLPPGDYQMAVSLSGFETVRRAVRLEPGAAVLLEVILRVAILEQTVVTAAKAGEADVQSIPMAISAVPNEQLARLDTRTIEDVARMLPSVTFTQNSTNGQLSIRGIGTTLVGTGGDPSAAVYLDGVYLARPAMVFIDLLDLQRIEVLRGPQGTLYGRNAVGGAMSLVSRPPANTREMSARITAGSLGELRAEARISGPLKRDRVTGSLAMVRGVREGYVRDLEHPDHRLGGDDLLAARGQLKVVLGRGADLLVASDVSDQQGIPLTYNKVLRVKPGFVVDNPDDLHEVRTSMLASARVLASGASARFTLPLTPSATLMSLSAYRRLTNEFFVDADITELDLFTARSREPQHQWSEELTVTHRGRRLTSIGGVFLFDETDRQTIHADLPAGGIGVFLDPRVNAGSAAVFAQTTLGITSRLAGTAGLRYVRERKRIENRGGMYPISSPETLNPGSSYQFTDAIEYTSWTPKFSVEARLPRQVLGYLSATRGFKSGGFNSSSTQPGRGFGPEWVWSYEGGLKTQPLDRARLNVSAFVMDYTNLQVQTPVGIGVFDIRNAAAATIRGVEVEGAARLGRGAEAGGHVTWLDATYDEYLAVSPQGIVGDVAGRRLNNAPEWAGRLWIEWNGSVRSSDLVTVTVDASAQSTVFYTPFNDEIQRQGPYMIAGARAEYGPAHRRWSVNAYVRNLTGTDYVMATFATSPAAYGGRPGASRQGGVQLVLRR